MLEVETPLLAKATVSDPHIDSMQVAVCGGGVAGTSAQTHFLQSSPEFAMKRLLASGSGPIYQTCKAFRNGEQGKKHNPEFTLLEWYRPQYDDIKLMFEIEELMSLLLNVEKIERTSYRQIFQHHLGIDPHVAELSDLKAIAKSQLQVAFEDDNKDVWLNLLLSHLIEPKLVAPIFIYDFPATQAALATLATDESGCLVAKRFELYIQGIELATGYFELIDPKEQRVRFSMDQARRKNLGLTQHPLDEKLLSALEHGLPSCAGVALGLDRLLMLLAGSETLEDVIAFSYNAC